LAIFFINFPLYLLGDDIMSINKSLEEFLKRYEAMLNEIEHGVGDKYYDEAF